MLKKTLVTLQRKKNKLINFKRISARFSVSQTVFVKRKRESGRKPENIGFYSNNQVLEGTSSKTI